MRIGQHPTTASLAHVSCCCVACSPPLPDAGIIYLATRTGLLALMDHADPTVQEDTIQVLATKSWGKEALWHQGKRRVPEAIAKS